MCGSKVHHVDIVAYTGSVMGRVIVSEDTEPLAFSDCYLRDIRHQVNENVEMEAVVLWKIKSEDFRK